MLNIIKKFVKTSKTYDEVKKQDSIETKKNISFDDCICTGEIIVLSQETAKSECERIGKTYDKDKKETDDKKTPLDKKFMKAQMMTERMEKVREKPRKSKFNI